MIVNNETLKSLSKLLNINYRGTEQEWALEFANPDRIDEFLNIASNVEYSLEEKYAIVSLILASYDDYLNININGNDKLWKDIIKLLDENPQLYQELLDYWAIPDETTTDYFAITPLIRTYIIRNKH